MRAAGLETLSSSSFPGPGPGIPREVGTLSLDRVALARDSWQLQGPSQSLESAPAGLSFVRGRESARVS